MQNPEPPVIKRTTLFHRLLSPRQWPKYLFGLACLATLAALVITMENRRELLAQTPGGGSGKPSPEFFAAQKLVAPAVPDDQNFAAIPYFTMLFDKATIAQSRERWPETFLQADRLPRRLPPLNAEPSSRETGRRFTDMAAWKKAFALVQGGVTDTDKPDEIPYDILPDPATNAAAAPAVLEALKGYQPVLDEMHAAKSRPYARFPIRYTWDNPWGILLPHLAYVKQTCQLLRLKASAELAAGNSAAALEDISLMLRLVEAPRDEPVLISHLVRVACLEITFSPIWEGLAQHRWSDEQLRTLQASLQKIDLLADLEKCTLAEKTWGNLTISLFRDKRSPVRLVNLLSESDKSPESWVKQADKALSTAPREWFDAEQKNYNELFDHHLLGGIDFRGRKVSPSVVDENVRTMETAIRGTKTLAQDHLVFSRGFLPALGRTSLKLAGTQGYTDMAVIACALERHHLATGEFPSSLDALVPRYLAKIPRDIVGDEPLHYQKTSDGLFVLYSIGWNEVDDRGELGFLASGNGPEKKDGDWVWRYPSAAKK